MPSPSIFSKPAYVAGGNVRPARIVTASSSVQQSAVEAAAVTSRPIGVTQNYVRRPPGSGEDDGFHAISSEPITYYANGEVADVLVGGAITDLNVPLVSDAQGRAIPATFPVTESARHWRIGYPLKTAAAAGEIVKVVLDIRDEFGYATPA